MMIFFLFLVPIMIRMRVSPVLVGNSTSFEDPFKYNEETDSTDEDEWDIVRVTNLTFESLW